MKQRFGPALIVFLGAASYGVLATIVKIGYGMNFTVNEVTGGQSFFGAIILWLIAFTQYKKWHKIPLNKIIIIMTVGTLAGLTGILYYASLLYVPASIAIVLLFQFTWIGFLIEWFLDKKKPSVHSLISLAVILLGTLLAANIFAAEFIQLSSLGLGLGFASAFTYAGFIYVSGRVGTEVTPWLRSPLMVTGSCILTFIIFPPTFLTSGALMEGLLYIALAIAIFGAVLPTICFTVGVPKIGVGLATILSSVELPVSVFMAWLILAEEVALIQWLGIALIIGAIAYEKKGESI